MSILTSFETFFGLPVFFVCSFLFYFACFFALGALFGSFANVVIKRLPLGESIVSPRSHCRSCQTTLRIQDNIPIISWFLLKGRCHHCHSPFSFRYVVVECLMGILFAFAWARFGWSLDLLENMILIFGLVTVSFIDLDHLILPDSFTISGIFLGLAFAFFNPNAERDALDSILGVLFGGGALWGVAYVYTLFRNEEGLGGGDIKLLACLGAFLGWKAIPFVILIASLLGASVGIVAALKSQKGLKTTIPFGPFLVAAALLFLFAGNTAGDWYWHLFMPWLGSSQ